MKRSSKTADLLKVLGAKLASSPKPVAAKPRPVTRAATPPLPKPRPQKRQPARTAVPAQKGFIRGKDVHIWLHDEDQRLIQELAVWLLSQRKRINSSLVLKTVLRAAKTGPDLLAAYDEAIKVDARLPRKTTDANAA